MSVEAQRPNPEETPRGRDAHAGEGRSPEWDYPADRAGIDPETARKFSDRWSEFAEQKSKIDAGKAAMIKLIRAKYGKHPAEQMKRAAEMMLQDPGKIEKDQFLDGGARDIYEMLMRAGH